MGKEDRAHRGERRDDGYAEGDLPHRSQGLGAHVVTQFSFAPNRIVEYCADLARRAPNVPVYVGLPGPTSPRTLLRYAQRGGSTRDKTLMIVDRIQREHQLTALARHMHAGSASNVVGVHLYSFGGVATTAHWMNARITARRG